MPEEYIENGQQRFRPSAQLVTSQGDIQSLPMSDNLPNGDWKDSVAYKAQLLSQYEQRAYDLSLWKYQQNFMNEYNSPKAQMARFGEAGLNPYLIYNQDNAASAVSYHGSTPLKGSSNYGRDQEIRMQATKNLVDTMLGTYSAYLNSKSTAADIAQKEANISYTNEQAGRVRLENAFTRWLMGEGDYDFSDTGRGQEFINRLSIQEGQKDIQSKRLSVYDEQMLSLAMDRAYKAALMKKADETTQMTSLENDLFTAEPGSDEWWQSLFYNAKQVATGFVPFYGRGPRPRGRRPVGRRK